MAEMIAGARVYVDIPAPPVAPGGLLGAARVVEAHGDHALMGAQYLSDACAEANEWTEWCTMTPTGTKVFDHGPDVIEGDPFAVYAGVECDLQTQAEATDRAQRRLAYAEGRSVDMAVAAWLDDNSLDLGGPLPVVEAIGVCEAYASRFYGGVATILVPRLFVPCACEHGVISYGPDGSLVTCQGSLVANITTDVPAPITTATGTVYVTGQITLLRSDVLSFTTPQQPFPNGTWAPPRALAERVYVPLIECIAARIEVSCS